MSDTAIHPEVLKETLVQALGDRVRKVAVRLGEVTLEVAAAEIGRAHV